MKTKISKTDRIVVGIATFFGLAIILNIRQSRFAFTTAKHPGQNGLIGWWNSRFNIYKFTPMWRAVHDQWVELASTEGEAKDAFFSLRDGHSPEDTEQLLENATRKWVSFLRNQSDDYCLNMLKKIVWYWTPGGSSANRITKNVFNWVMDFRIVTATTRNELLNLSYYAQYDEFLLGKIDERLSEMKVATQAAWQAYLINRDTVVN